mmetsp:Transcript_44530/g.85634  ORF Transcript_44530/g.85634 Transcript_44530/m.85634 type:complete len:83 (-) Transcript_44530:249-497(-)
MQFGGVELMFEVAMGSIQLSDDMQMKNTAKTPESAPVSWAQSAGMQLEHVAQLRSKLLVSSGGSTAMRAKDLWQAVRLQWNL